MENAARDRIARRRTELARRVFSDGAGRLTTRAGRYWPFLVWLAAFYLSWLAIVAAGDHWATLTAHWPIAAAMVFGSYFAGSTPVGGGAIAFPLLVLVFDEPGSLGRNFAFAIQSIGMVSASLFLFSARRKLQWSVLRPAMIGALGATPLGAAWVAPAMPDLAVKLTFAVVWASFGLMHLVKWREIVAAKDLAHEYGGQPSASRTPRATHAVGLTAGIAGGLVSSIIGVGAEMILYAVLVLFFRRDLKVAIPTAVVLMAFTSLVGLAVNLALAEIDPSRYAMDPGVFAHWLAAAPIVALGAPLGAFIVHAIPRSPTLLLISVLCIAQFVWTLCDVKANPGVVGASVLGVLAMSGVLTSLYGLGRAR